jgi:type IV secretion system protein VirB8
MNEHSRETLDAYYAEAASWNRDRVQAMHASRRVAWWIAAGAAAIALLEALALVLLTPLKTVEPYTLMVDRTTGYVQALKPLDQTRIAPNAALTQSFLVQYVIAREGFDMATLNANYRKVALFSADTARSSYLHQMQVSNPASPLVVYPRNALVEVRVKSVSPLGGNAALVRFDTVRGDAGAQRQPPASWVAVVRYRYSDAPMSLDDRFVNPLGFQVTSYRKDAEVLTPQGAPSA